MTSAQAAASLPATMPVNSSPDEEHFHGCPTPTGEPFDCDYCQNRAAAMGGSS